MTDVIERLRGGLIVSCQALAGEPMFGPPIMARMARAAAAGGAAAIRANSPADVAAIRAAVSLPIVGLWKQNLDGYDPYITPTLASALALRDAGADIIALDATLRPHPEGTTAEFLRAVRAATGRPILADIATEAEALAAQAAGADLVSTTLSGYTPDSPHLPGPDLDLVRRLARVLAVPLLAEGRIHTPGQARAALDAGAYAVVVGGAITRPQQITERFLQALHHDVPGD